MTDRKTIAREVAGLVRRLPRMPESVARLMEATDHTDLPLTELRALVKGDPALCASLFLLANTGRDRSLPEIETINEALEAVGKHAASQLIGISHITDSLEHRCWSSLHLEEHTAHGQDISLSCRILAELAGLDEHTCAMYTVAGLIHDMGRLVMASASDRACATLLGTSWYELSHIVEREREFLGLDHCTVGMEITKKWNFSPVLQEGILRHHSPVREGEKFSIPGAFVFLAHFVSVSDLTGAILARTLPAEVFETLGLTVETFDKAQRIYRERVGTD